MADNTQLFFNEYVNKYVDVDGYPKKNPYQCKDIIQKYVKECLALPTLPQGDAWQMWDKAPTKLYNKILNTPKAVPKKGDIVIWRKVPLYLPSGHIAIFDSGTTKWMKCFGQNWATGTPCHIQDHSYMFVKGWLRKK